MNLIILSIIILIESSGNPLAYNEHSQARGLCQITPICLTEYNNFHKGEEYNLAQLYEPGINKRIASWYLNKRIPQMLRYYKKPVTVENCLIAYNAGIKYVVEGWRLPRETEDYIKKYKKYLDKLN